MQRKKISSKSEHQYEKLARFINGNFGRVVTPKTISREAGISYNATRSYISTGNRLFHIVEPLGTKNHRKYKICGNIPAHKAHLLTSSKNVPAGRMSAQSDREWEQREQEPREVSITPSEILTLLTYARFSQRTLDSVSRRIHYLEEKINHIESILLPLEDKPTGGDPIKGQQEAHEETPFPARFPR